MREVGDPNVMLILGVVRKEEVGIDVRLLLGFVPFLAPPAIGLESVEVHHPQDAFLVQLEGNGETFVPICRMLSECLLDRHLACSVTLRHLGAIVHAPP